MGEFIVIRTPAFDLLAKQYAREHPKFDADILKKERRIAKIVENIQKLLAK